MNSFFFFFFQATTITRYRCNLLFPFAREDQIYREVRRLVAPIDALLLVPGTTHRVQEVKNSINHSRESCPGVLLVYTTSAIKTKDHQSTFFNTKKKNVRGDRVLGFYLVRPSKDGSLYVFRHNSHLCSPVKFHKSSAETSKIMKIVSKITINAQIASSSPTSSSSNYGSGALRPVVGVSQHKFRGTVRPAGVQRRRLDQRCPETQPSHTLGILRRRLILTS